MNTSSLAFLFIPFSVFTYAGFEPIDDDGLSSISGKGGVTIVSDIHATVGRFVYTDEGSIAINDIEIGGANKDTYFGKDWGASSHSGPKLDGSLVTIDVLNDGDLVIAGSVDPKMGGGLIDFGISTGGIELVSKDLATTTRFIESINITGIISKFRTKLDAQTSHIKTETEFGVDDFDIDISGLNMKVEDGFIAASTYFESLEDWGPQGLALQDVTTKVSFDLYADDDGLHIDTQNFEFDMQVGMVSIGDNRVGLVQLDDVNISQSSMLINGHP